MPHDNNLPNRSSSGEHTHVREAVRVHGQAVGAQPDQDNGRGQRPGHGTDVEPRRRLRRAKAAADGPGECERRSIKKNREKKAMTQKNSRSAQPAGEGRSRCPALEIGKTI